MTGSTDPLTAARAEALFSSDLPTGSTLTRPEAGFAVRRALRAHGGTRGCAVVLAVAYGNYPETSVARMRWALEQIRTCYPRL
jgi:hypothetical protein